MSEEQTTTKRSPGRPAKRRPGFERPVKRKATPEDVEILEEMFRDPMREVMEDAREALGAKGRDKHLCFFNEKTNPNTLRRRGYEPVVTGGEGDEPKHEWGYNEMTLWMINEAKFQRRDRASALFALQQLDDTMAGNNDDYPGIKPVPEPMVVTG